MGYTHYWRRPRTLDAEKFRLWAADVRTLLENLPSTTDTAGGFYKDSPLRICGVEGTGAPVIDDERIEFNGSKRGDLWHEGFYVERHIGDRRLQDDPWMKASDGSDSYGDCTKTSRKPYDLLVCAALIRFLHHFGAAVEVRSDGNGAEWEPARALCERLFGGPRYVDRTGDWRRPVIGIGDAPLPPVTPRPADRELLRALLRDINQQTWQDAQSISTGQGVLWMTLRREGLYVDGMPCDNPPLPTKQQLRRVLRDTQYAGLRT